MKKECNLRRKGVMTEIKRFLQEEDGIGVVEVILILVVLLGLIVIFKKQLTTIVNNAFSSINSKANSLK